MSPLHAFMSQGGMTPFDCHLTGNASNVNLVDEFSIPDRPMLIYVRVDVGVTISGDFTVWGFPPHAQYIGLPALDMTDVHSDSVISLENLGSIKGAGGQGGNG